MNKTLRIMIVFGTRPEAIKMVPVFESLANVAGIEVKVCVTAQHRQMLDQVLELFGIRPDFDLDLMKPNQGLTDITTNVLQGMHTVLKEWRPDWVLIHGDTTTTLATSLAAYYEKIPVGHVEAGLRTGNIYSPWPEEANRRIASIISAVHFAPTETSKTNLIKEGIDGDRVIVVGNTVIDTLLGVVARIRNDADLRRSISHRFEFLDDKKKLILVTGHRRENFGDGLLSVCDALSEISARGDVQVVFPVHPNPSVRDVVTKQLAGSRDVFLIEPQDYLPFVFLMEKSYLLLTDSGGIQEEAPSLGRPVLVMRNTTERPEAVSAGTVRLVGTDKETIVREVSCLLESSIEYQQMVSVNNPYGDGHAAKKIANYFTRQVQ
jgi:UDP-N-acetylglucosamine 2-epimerase (non-hydrolysing)